MELTITVPEGWEDIKLSKYLAYAKALKPYEGSPEYEQVMYEKAINHFCDLSTDMLRKLPMENYDGIMELMRLLFQQGEQMPVVKKFVVGSTEFGFIPHLDDMTYGEYLDLSTYSKDIWQNLPTFLSIVYRPVTKKDKDTYEIETYNGTNDDMVTLFTHALTMDIVWGAIGFFTILQRDLLKGMGTYSIQILEKMKTNTQVLETLAKNGVDMSLLQSSQTMISQSLMRLPD
jgi:hypothetical protein